MNISLLGYFVIPFGIVCFFLKRKHLYWVSIFAAVFFSLNVANFPSITFHLNVPNFFLILLITKEIFYISITNKSFKKPDRAQLYLIFFFVVAGLSLIMPVIINGTDSAMSVEMPIDSFTLEPIMFRRVNVTQYLYLVFFCTVFFVLCRQMISFERILRTVKVLIWASLLVLFSGFFHQTMHILGKQEELKSLYAFCGTSSQIYTLFGLPRMSSISGEPSFTVIYLLMGICLLFPQVVRNEYIYLTRKMTYFFIMLLVIGLLLSGSTTGFLGLIVVFLLFLWMAFRRHSSHIARYIKMLFFLAIPLLLSVYIVKYVAGIDVVSYIQNLHVSKVVDQTQSGLPRWRAILYGWELFTRHPILGTGFGSANVFSWIVSMLANIGILGTYFFILFNATLLVKCYKLARRNDRLGLVAESLFLANVSYLIVCSMAHSLSTFILPIFWILLALLCSLCHISGLVPKTNPVLMKF